MFALKTRFSWTSKGRHEIWKHVAFHSWCFGIYAILQAPVRLHGIFQCNGCSVFQLTYGQRDPRALAIMSWALEEEARDLASALEVYQTGKGGTAFLKGHGMCYRRVEIVRIRCRPH